MTSNADPLGRLSSARTGTLATSREVLSRPVILALFLVCATQPYGLEVGSLLIGPYRLILLLIGPILTLQWLLGRFGRWLLPDFLILGYALWILVCLAANGQSGRIIEWGGALFIDTFFAYLLGRAAIRNRRDFYFFTRVLLYVLLFLLPFAILESTQNLVILIPLVEGLPMVRPFDIVVGHHPPRLGLLRAQTGAVHPIAYGVTCSMGFSFGLAALAYAPGRPGLGKRLILSVGSYMGTFFSLSAGAIISILIQGGLIIWNWTLRGWRQRWYALAAGCLVFYIIVAIVSARPPALTLARMVAFSPSTAWNRYMIWQFGSAEVARNPIFGMGNFVEWQRAPWMPPSIDNEWLLTAMRFGLVGIGLIMGAFAYVLYRLIRKNFSTDPGMGAIRDAFVFTLISLLIAYGTVAAWNIQWSLLLVLLGGATWIFTTEAGTRPEAAADAAEDPDNDTPGRRRASRHTQQAQIDAREDRTAAPKYSRFTPHPRDGPPGD